MFLVDRVRCYFRNVIRTSDFVIAVDPTGVYLFISDGCENEILIKASSIMETLDLQREELIICKVSQDAELHGRVFFDFCTDNLFSNNIIVVNPEEFEDTLRRVTGERAIVFNDREITEILECFDSFVQRSEDGTDYLEKFNLNPDVRKRLDGYVPVNVQDVIACGISEKIAQQVFNTIREHNQYPVDSENAAIRDMPVMNDSRARNFATVSLLMAASGFVCELLDIPVASVIFAAIGIWYAGSLAVLYKTLWVMVCRAFNTGIFLVGICRGVIFFLPKIQDAFERAGFIIRV